MNNNYDGWHRSAAAAGLISVALFLVAWVVYGPGPKTGDSPETIHRFFAEQRDRVLWCLLIQGFGALAMVWFMSALVVSIKDAGGLLWAVAAGLTFILALSLGSSATMLRLGVAFVASGGAEVQTVTALFRLGHILDTSQNVISAGSYLTVAVTAIRTRFIPAWWGWASVLAALFAFISTTAWNLTGFWSPDGAGFVNLVIYIAWVGGTSLMLLRRASGTAV
jgi:hypothetical protein